MVLKERVKKRTPKIAFAARPLLANLKRERGFTLIELLVVIAIIGIMASIVLASVNTARSKARDARRLSDMRQTQIALELYFDDNRAYPSTGGE